MSQQEQVKHRISIPKYTLGEELISAISHGVGALLGAYLSRVAEDSHAFKANLNMVFAVENTFRIALYLITGVFTPEAFRHAVMLLPVMLLGLLAGMACSARMKEQTARRMVTLALTVSGLALMATSLRAML